MLVTDDLKAQEWGLSINRDAVMTASFPPPVEEGHFIRYMGSFTALPACSRSTLTPDIC